MTGLEVVARGPVRGARVLERLVCHPRLPLAAGLDVGRPAVHVWEFEGGELRELGSVGLSSAPYAHAFGWERMRRTPAVAWHPERPLLVVTGEDGLLQWTTDGVRALDGAPDTASYRGLAFSPDGQTLWGSPSCRVEGEDRESSDALHLASGGLGAGPRWDTGVAEHPGGGLVATLASDQGATHCLFARVDQGPASARMRVLNRALILDCDGYGTPLFSADGRHMAIRGNAYAHSVGIFEFPSLRRVLATTLGDPCPGYPYPQEWLDQLKTWSRHNIAFGSRPGVLWIGTPAGTLVEVDIATRQSVEHAVLSGSGTSALAATATGALLMAGSAGELVLLSEPAATTRSYAVHRDVARAAAHEFMRTATEVPDGDAEPDTHLVVTDGTRVWDADALATVNETDATDPTWLRIQAAVNNAR